MPKAAVMHTTGGPDVLQIQNVPEPKAPGPGQVLLRHTAIALNYIDVYYREGWYKPRQLPFIPGMEACGVIEAVGSGVNAKVGDRVAYCTAPSGAYAEKRLIHAKYLVTVPNEISDEVAAAVLGKGMTAHYLTHRTYRINENDTILVHAAAGGTGQLLCQWAKMKGATIIGTVGSDEKIRIARSVGCDHVINYTAQDLVSEVSKITDNEGVTVAYDSVGKETFMNSLKCMRPFGLLVSYGMSSGPVPPFNILHLAPKGVFVTRPTLMLYKQAAMEYVLTAIEVFKMVSTGKMSPNIGQVYRFDEIPKAHADLQSRTTFGQSIIKV